MSLALGVFLVWISLVAGYSEGKATAPNWNSVYTTKGTLYIPYAEITEPFYAWYSSAAKQSRIDYYGGMVKTYQLGTFGQFGSSLKIAPVTTETELNANTCLQVNGTEEFSITPQSVLPSLVGFECIGEEVVNGFQTEKWQKVENFGQKTNTYNVWMRYKDDPNNVGIKYAVPIRYEMKGFNSLLGSHYDHYYLDYDFYSIDTIDPQTFEVENLTCSSFPGPGDRHIYTFNPMREFIHPVTTSHVDFEFQKFKLKHNKQYDDEQAHSIGLEAFRQNVRFIHAVNRQQRGYTLGVNHLADQTEKQLLALRGKQFTTEDNGADPFPYTEHNRDQLPSQFDWRLYGAVTPVKDQSVCGSCWSFGTVGTLEGAYFLKTGRLTQLSEQALIDCTWGYGNNGCDGGEDFRVYQWMLKHGGIPTAGEYGDYLGQDGYCHANNTNLVAKINSYVNVTANDLAALRLAIVKQGPISVSIDASHRTFSFYSNGVYYEKECKNKVDELDHAVLAVGYGTMNKKDYWLIKNSWSTYWGNDGYVLMSAEKNNCGVMTSPTYVTM